VTEGAFSLAVLETAREYRFFEGLGLSALASCYAGLNRRIAGETDPEALYLRVGWGCGWEAATGFNTDEYLRDRVRATWNLGRPNADVFPKTRHLVYAQKQVRQPWGWLRLAPERAAAA
jgi:hypothetical protein